MDFITDISLVWYIIGGILIALTIGLWVGVGFFLRWLADNGWFWVRVPEMYAVFIMKDRNLSRVLIACSNDEKLLQLKEMIDGKEKIKDILLSRLQDSKFGPEDFYRWVRQNLTESKDTKIEIIPDGKLVWIGFPWKGVELHSWYEFSKDDDNPGIDPFYKLYLGERTWDYTTPENANEKKRSEFIEKWGVDTADPIQVTPKLVVTVEVMGPEKTVFGIEYYQEAIQKEVLSGWKWAVQELEYFTYENESAEKDKVDETPEGLKQAPEGKNKNLQKFAQEKLNEFLGLSTKVNSPHDYDHGSPVWIIYREYGVWVKRVRIRDIDPTDPQIRVYLQLKLKAQTEAAAKVETAKGERDARKIKADGEVYETTNVGKAKGDAINSKLVGKAKGLKRIKKDLGIDKEQAGVLYLSEQAIEMVQKAQYTYFTHGQENVGNMLLATGDRLGKAVESFRGDTPQAKKMSTEEMKQLIDQLPADQKQKLFESELSEQVEDGGETDEQNESKKQKDSGKQPAD